MPGTQSKSQKLSELGVGMVERKTQEAQETGKPQSGIYMDSDLYEVYMGLGS